MKFIFLFLGKTREKYLDEGVKDYVKRLRRFVEIDIVVLKESASKKLPENELKKGRQNSCWPIVRIALLL